MGAVDEVNNLGAMADAVAPELLYCGTGTKMLRYCRRLRCNRKKLREFVEKEHMLWYAKKGGVS